MMAEIVEHVGSDVIAPLGKVLAYRNPLVIHGFTKRFAIPVNEAEVIFVEMLRWLWYLANNTPSDDNPEADQIDDPMVVIDEMWHEFILVTPDYTRFCREMFGQYIHHVPNGARTDSATAQHGTQVKQAMAELLARKRAKYEAIYDCLGKETFILWYLVLPERYGAGSLVALRRR